MIQVRNGIVCCVDGLGDIRQLLILFTLRTDMCGAICSVFCMAGSS